MKSAQLCTIASRLVGSARRSLEPYVAGEVAAMADKITEIALSLRDNQTSASSASARVFVLRLNYIILGVLTNEDRAIHEAKTLIEALTRLQREQWIELQKDRMWRSSDGRWLEINAHDVR